MFIPIHDANPLRHIHFHYATFALIAANVAVFFLFQGAASETEALAFTLIPATFTGVQPRPDAWTLLPEELTLLTYAFLHLDIWHLAGNMVFLWVFGDNVEDAVGHVRFFFFYCACAIAAGIVQVAVAPDAFTPTLGASGAVAGVVAAYLMLHPRVRIWVLFLARIPLRLSALWLIGAWVVYQVWNALTAGEDGVAWWAHLGGIAAGAFLILFIRQRGVALFDRDLPVATARVPSIGGSRPSP